VAACDKAQGQSGRFWFDRAAVDAHLSAWTRSTHEDEAALWPEPMAWAGLEDGVFPVDEAG
jgi:hypothetical protein